LPWSWKLVALAALWLTPHYFTIPHNIALYDLVQIVLQLSIISTILPASLNSVANREKTNHFIVSCVIMHCLQYMTHQASKYESTSNVELRIGTDHSLMLKLHNAYTIAHTLTHERRLVPFCAMFCMLHYLLAVMLLIFLFLRQPESVAEFSTQHVLFLLFIGELYAIFVKISCQIIFVLAEQYENYFTSTD